MPLRRAALAATLLLLAACKRDADQPLPQAALYPDAGPTARQPTAAGPLQRVQARPAHEPDDRPELAAVLPPDAVVDGILGDGEHGAQDVDWYRVEPLPEPGGLWRAELQGAPECARLALFDRPDADAPAREARPHGDEAAVLPSLALPGRQAWLRIRCESRKGKTPAAPAPYRLVLGSRPARPEEEREPNDVAGAQTRLLGVGAVVQGLLQPAGDVDVFRLELSNALPGDATLLSVTGVPGVALALELRVAGRDEPVLRRVGARGEALLVPNLDVRRTGTTPLLVLRAVKGGSPTHAYAATIRPLLPAGCRTQGACPERIPVEREPNDAPADAMGIRAGGTITAVLDNPDDVDVYAIDGEPGQILRVTVDPPEGVRVAVAIAEGNQAWAELEGESPGAPVAFAGRRIHTRRVWVTVRSLAGSDRTSPYTVDARLRDEPAFEHEGEPRTPLYATEAGVLTEGTLHPAGDIDVFGHRVAETAGPRTMRLDLRGDGRPGLSAQLRTASGAVLASVVADDGGEVGAAPVVVAPGEYDVVVERAAGPAGELPYRVRLVDLGPAALPAEVTPTTPTTPTPTPSATGPSPLPTP